MSKSVTEKIMYSPDYLDILLTIFLKQDSKQTYLACMAAEVFHQHNALDITKSREYIRTLRICRDLEKEKLIKKIKPAKKEKGKTHYVIDLENFAKFILKYIRSLPAYTLQIEDLFKKINNKKMHLIDIYIGLFYRGVAHDYIHFIIADRENRLALKGFNLRDTVFVLIDKVAAELFRKKSNAARPLESKYLKDINKIKSPEKKNLHIFLSILKLLETYYTPYQYFTGHGIDLHDFYAYAVKGNKKGWQADKFKRIMKNKQEVFHYLPTDN